MGSDDDVQVRLPRTYDPLGLKADLTALQDLPFARQPGPYHDGRWTGISLYSQGGRIGASAGGAGLDPYRPTAALSRTPHIRKLLEGLDCPKLAVRILALPPGATIGKHFDARVNFQCGMLRLHVPIVTHPDVLFEVAGVTCDWSEGELWYADFSRPHMVANRSPLTRVHLVIDVEINPFVLALFPESFVARRMAEGEGITLARFPRVGAVALEQYECEFNLPVAVAPLFGEGRAMATFAGGGVVELKAIARRLVAIIDGRPRFALAPLDDSEFRIVGLPTGCTMHILVRDGAVREVSLRLRGLPQDLYAAQLGSSAGPSTYSQIIPLPLAR